MGGLYIYKQYTLTRNIHKQNKINLKNAEKDEVIHKAKICLEVLLKFIHEGIDEQEDIDITNLKPKDFIEWYTKKLGNRKFYEIMLYIQRRVGTYI